MQIRKIIVFMFVFSFCYSSPYFGVSVGNSYLADLLFGYELKKMSIGADISWWFNSYPSVSDSRQTDFAINPAVECRMLVYNSAALKWYSIVHLGTELSKKNSFFVSGGLGLGLEHYFTDNLAIIGQYSLDFTARNYENTMWSLYQSPAIRIIYCFGKDHF